MKIETFVTGMLGTNCYLVSNEETKECILIDPAVCAPEIVRRIQEDGLSFKAILLTHGHFDHIMGIDGFLKAFSVPVYACREEEAVLCDASINASADYTGGYTYAGAVYTEDGQVLRLAGMDIKVLHTPGHTVGGCCYYIEEEHTLFSGDTLFFESVGRTDLPTGSGSSLARSIREKLFVLPEDTVVYPGHMEATSIGHEKRYNPYV